MGLGPGALWSAVLILKVTIKPNTHTHTHTHTGVQEFGGPFGLKLLLEAATEPEPEPEWMNTVCRRQTRPTITRYTGWLARCSARYLLILVHRQLAIRLLLLPSNDLAPQVHQSLPQRRQRRRAQIIRNVVVCILVR